MGARHRPVCVTASLPAQLRGICRLNYCVICNRKCQRCQTRYPQTACCFHIATALGAAFAAGRTLGVGYGYIVGGDAGRTGVGRQRSAWMQPSANMKPRAVLTKSAPTHSAHAALADVISLPAAITLIRLLRSACSSESTTRGNASAIGRLMWSINVCGAAPAAFTTVDRDKVRRILLAPPQHG